METAMPATLWRVRSSMAWWGGRGCRDGALEHAGWAREGWWPRWLRATSTAAFGHGGGEAEERGGGRSRERGRSERGSGTSPWRREEVGEAATAKQEVEASACARACGVRPPRRGGRRQGGRRRWAGPAGGTGPALVAARVRPGKWPRWPLSPFFFLFCFSFLFL